MIKSKNTITGIVNNELCTGCGTCIAICPHEAIKLAINEKGRSKIVMRKVIILGTDGFEYNINRQYNGKVE